MGKVKNFFREVSDSSDGDIVGEDSDDEMEENPDEEEDKESDLEMEEVVASSSKSSNSSESIFRSDTSPSLIPRILMSLFFVS